MTRRIFRASMMTLIPAMIVCAAIAVGMLYESFERSYAVELGNQTAIIAETAEKFGAEFLEGTDFGEVRVTLIDEDGNVLFDSENQSETMENHSEREEFLQAREQGYGESARYSETMDEKTYYVAQKLADGSVLRVSGTRASAWKMMKRIAAYIILAALLASIFALFLAKRLAKSVVKPINEIGIEHPEEETVYEELTPLLSKIRDQNRRIEKQMNELTRERREFEAITENMSEGLLLIDLQTNVLMSNRAAGEMLDEKPEIGESVYRCNREEAFRLATETALGGKAYSGTMKKDGRYINVLANPVYNEQANVGVVILLVDVTEREERETLRREFSANVSHELKTPLTAISATAEMIKSGTIKSEDVAHFADNTYREAQRLTSLVGDIIRLSQLDEGAFDGKFENADCKKLIENAAGAAEISANRKDIDLTIECEKITMRCIPLLFEEIAYNLLDNAVKYTPRGGRVSVSFKKERGVSVLRVKDNGIGIAKSEQERIFERFYRSDKSRSKEIEGTGLGLSIVKHGAAILGAETELVSEEGKGSEFILRFEAGE
ncbi:MAG: ATP-binding protein [Clostridia bacterium]|nr:ATP-binding protein [Clostridia bacterium]